MNRKIALITVLVVVSLLMIATAVFAEINPANSFFGSFGDDTGDWEQGNVVMYIPGAESTQPFGSRLAFNNTPVEGACVAENPGDPTSTIWAGQMILAHESIGPNGEPGFGVTSDWTIVECSSMLINGPGNDLREPPADGIIGTCTVGDGVPPIEGCEVDATQQDVPVEPCTGGACQQELQTIVNGNMDQDCNGLIDRNEDADPDNDISVGGNGQPNDLCFYWKAEKPPEDGGWTNIQSSIEGLSGGESTVNFSITPTAISLINFAASDSPIGPSMAMVILLPLGLLGLAVAALLWKRTTLA